MKPSFGGILLGLFMLLVGVYLFYISGIYYFDEKRDFMAVFGVAVFVNILGTLILNNEMKESK